MDGLDERRMNSAPTERGSRSERMGKQANSLERGLASMSFCPRCGLQLPEGSSFCYQCGAHLREGETITPQLGADATPPQFGLAGAGEISRFTPHAADEPICCFCKGPLDLSGEFCEMCGAPVSEAAPSRWLRRAPVASPVVSKESSPPKPAVARLAGPPTANATSPPAARSYVPSPSMPSRPEEKASRTPPINTSPHPRADQLRIARQEARQTRCDLAAVIARARPGNFGPGVPGEGSGY